MSDKLTSEQPVSFVDHQQRRGIAEDIILEAINAYDSFMLDDDYDGLTALNQIMRRVKDRYTLIATHPTSQKE